MVHRLRFFPVLFFALLPIATLPAQGYLDIPPIIVDSGKRVIKVAVESPDPQVESVAIRCFNLHGGFTPVRTGAEVTVRFEPAGERSMVIRITHQGKATTETISGTDKLTATLQAADRVVLRVIGRPGFFSGRLALVGENTGHKEIYESDMLFQRLRRITSDGSISISPRWSPDGSRLLYTTYFRTGFPDIYELNLASGQRRPIATYRGANNGAAYSPDGRQIAMILSSPGNQELFVSDANGQSPKRLTRNRSAESSPSWSPDGRRIAVTSDQLGKPQIFAYNLLTNDFTRIRTNISGYCAEPAWNPVNPDLIAFTISQGGGFEVAVYSFRSGTSTTVSRGSGDAIEPQWLNDGRHLVYTRRQGGTTALHVLDTETGSSAPLHSPKFGNASQATFWYPGG